MAQTRRLLRDSSRWARSISFWSVRVSANTAANITHETRDSLLTNGVAQAAKAKMSIYIYPADQYEGAVTTILPDGNKMTLYMRDVDVENADRLKQMQGITVLESIREIEDVVRRHVVGIDG